MSVVVGGRAGGAPSAGGVRRRHGDHLRDGWSGPGIPYTGGDHASRLDAARRQRHARPIRACGSMHPPRRSYPACQAVKAAADQGLDGPYLRVVREGLMVAPPASSTAADALIGAARAVAGLDVERFAHRPALRGDRRGLRRRPGARAGRRARRRAARRLPVLRGARRGRRRALGLRQRRPRRQLRAAALAAGGEPRARCRPCPRRRCAASGASPRPRWPPSATAPARWPPAELWRLAAEWKVRAERVLTGELWQAA